MPEKIKVMLVDDSAVMRSIVSGIVNVENDMELVVAANNAEIALGLLNRKGPDRPEVDIIILDIEMPQMDGITALPKILEASPKSKVIMSSTLTQRNAESSVKALELGATEYIPKPTAKGKNREGLDDFSRELVEKIRAIGHKQLVSRVVSTPPAKVQELPAQAKIPEQKEKIKIQLKAAPLNAKFRALAIGSSTGGPQALSDFFGAIKNQANKFPIFITQHMPANFTAFMAERLGKISGVPCREAIDGEKVQAGNIYVAPGDFHMVVQRSGVDVVIKLNQDTPENFCRPAVDPMLRSLAEVYGKEVLVVILTGMGSDGQKGAQIIADKGGVVIAQDEASSVVWGMPGAAAKAGICTEVLPLVKIPESVLSFLSRSK